MGLDASFYRDLCDPGLHAAAEAIALSRRHAQDDPLFTYKLARAMLDESGELESEKASRLVTILGEVSSALRISLIVPLLNHSDPRVRSKASLLVTKANADLKWICKLMQQSDTRVRANLIEALWGVDDALCRTALIEACKDPDNRVVGNALLGLYRIRDSGAVDKIIAMAKHPKDEFRATAVWVMEKSGDARFVPVLSELLKEPGKILRPSILRALARIKIARLKANGQKATASP